MSFGFDPFQVFDVQSQPCMVVEVVVVRGHNITKGSEFKNWMDTPDPYVTLCIPSSPHGTQRTSTVDNDFDPVWNEKFEFYLNPEVHNELEVTLIDDNYTFDEFLANVKVDLTDIKAEMVKNTVKKSIVFHDLIRNNEPSLLDIELSARYVHQPELRYSLTLCNEEKEYVAKRRQVVFDVMQELLGEDAPLSLEEVPTIGVLGSGGGFRAMTAFSGVMGALVDTRILDMVTYNVGLSGSAWYLSTLYSHPDFPKKSPKELRPELRDSIQSSPLWLLNVSSIVRYLSRIMEKRKQGQPVSFTDLFGHLVGETLLKGRLDAKLSDQQEKIKDGLIPMPMYSCLHVKKSVSAMVFHEWMEFSPYEIGMPKYGTFMKPSLFGSKFFLGHLIKQHNEPPLHFLQGIWGSAFCIQIKRLLHDDKKVSQLETLEQEREELERELSSDMSSQDLESSDTSDDENEGLSRSKQSKKYTGPKPKSDESGKKNGRQNGSFWKHWLGSMFESHPLLKSIDGRAATVHNFMRGLTLYKAYPFSPFTSDGVRNIEDKLSASSYFSKQLKIKSPKKRSFSGVEDETDGGGTDQFDGIFEMYPTSIKKLYVVDGGLSFNSPYPLLLRPQRAVDIILSFDFSQRPSDTSPPFKELLLAEEWARKNSVPFPKIDPTVVDREGLKECYVFEDPTDPRCPIVMHFVLINISFSEEKKPGVRRRKEERAYADFAIFDDPNKPYSTFNFKYSNIAFDRLADLMEFNTLKSYDLIIDKIKQQIKDIRKYSFNRKPFMLKDIKNLRIGKNEKEQLKNFLKSFDEGDGDVPIS